MTMRLSLFAVALTACGLLFLAGCASSPQGNADDRTYVDDRTLEAFDRDLKDLASAVQRADESAERSLRAKISESARLYQVALLSALHDDSSISRRSLAATMLGFTGDSSVVSPLLATVESEEPDRVRLNAMLGLATLGDKLRDHEDHAQLMEAFRLQLETPSSSYMMRRAAVLAYAVAYDGALNDSILPLRDRFLSDPDVRVQLAAINAMGDIGDTAAVPDLTIVGLQHPEPDIRAASAVALGKIADPTRVLPALEAACRDESAIVRRQSIDAISKHHGSDPERVYSAIVAGLSDFDERVRESSALALARLNDPRAIDSLIQATGDRTAVVRQAAAESLGSLITADREKESFPLVELLTDQNPGVRGAAHRSLRTVTRQDHGEDQTRWRTFFYKKYPELDPALMYGDGPKPRVSSGIQGGTRRTATTQPRTQQPRTQQPRTQQPRTQQPRTRGR